MAEIDGYAYKTGMLVIITIIDNADEKKPIPHRFLGVVAEPIKRKRYGEIKGGFIMRGFDAGADFITDWLAILPYQQEEFCKFSGLEYEKENPKYLFYDYNLGYRKILLSSVQPYKLQFNDTAYRLADPKEEPYQLFKIDYYTERDCMFKRDKKPGLFFTFRFVGNDPNTRVLTTQVIFSDFNKNWELVHES